MYFKELVSACTFLFSSLQVIVWNQRMVLIKKFNAEIGVTSLLLSGFLYSRHFLFYTVV